jgi:hypothetical protein
MPALKQSPLPTIRAWGAIATVAFAPAFAMADDDALSAAREAGTFEIAVVERYEATSRWTGTTKQQDLPLMRQPYADLAKRLFELAGIAAASGAADLSLEVEAHGTAQATLYDSSVNGERIREPNYRAARIVGTIRLETVAGTIVRKFDGGVPAPYEFMVTFGYDLYRDPNNAPFREAFEAPGGYAATLAALVRDIYGEAVLLAALGDRDPLVQRAAELGLGQP